MTVKRSLKVLSGDAPVTRANSNVRARTLVHLQRMVAATALVNCSRPVQSETTITPKTTSDAGPFAPPTVSVPVTPPTGYAVVDPMPSPARCYGAAAGLIGKAVWKTDTTGMYIEITVNPTGGGVPSTVTGFNKLSTSVMGANLISTDLRGLSMLVRARPLAGNTFMSVSIGVECGAMTTPGAVVLSMTLAPGKPKVGDVISVSLIDR